MAEADSGDHTATKAGDKLPRAHKRCVNKDCGEVLSLATKYCKKCNAVQFEHRAAQKAKRGSKRDEPEDAGSSASEEGSDAGEVGDGQTEKQDMPEEEDEEDEDEEDEDVPGGHAAPELAKIPQATNYAIQQAQEAYDQEPFDGRTGPGKPMVELVAGSRQYYQASIIRESKTEVRLLFPATRKMAERIEWVDKRSSRIWRGRMEGPFWRFIKGSVCAWEPKPAGDAGGSFRRRGSGRSRGSAGTTRSRGTKHSTEGGTELADLHRAGAAALDTAASPKPRAPKRQLNRDRQQSRHKRPREEDVDASSAGSDAEQSSQQGQQGVTAGGRTAAPGGDPLEAWFRAHYALLTASGLMGAGLSPASAETGRLRANGAQRRRGRQQRGAQQQRAGGSARRSRDQRQQERHVASLSTEGDSSEDEGPAVAGSGGRGVSKGGRELARLQMWAWERRGRGGTSDDDSDEDSAEEGSTKRQALDAAQRPRLKMEEKPATEPPAGTAETGAAARQPAAAAAQQQQAQQLKGRQQGAEPGAPSPTAAAAKVPDARSAPGSAEGKQARSGKPAAATARGEPRQAAPASAAAAPQAAQPKPRPPPKPVAVLEECDVFGRVDTIRRQQSGMPPPPTSPRAGAGSSFGKPAGAAGASPPLPKAPSDASARAAGGAGAAAGPAPAAQEQQQQQAANGGSAQPGAGAAPAAAAAEPSKPPPLSPLKRKMLQHSARTAAAGTAAAEKGGGGPAGGGSTAAAGEPPGKRLHAEGAAQAQQ